MPYVPPKQLYSHRDPLLRRLRLCDPYGEPVDLDREFREAKVVLFFFGCGALFCPDSAVPRLTRPTSLPCSATWRNSSREPFDLVGSFARRHPHQLKVVYVSVDQNEAAYEANTRNKPWLSMECVSPRGLSSSDSR